MRPIRRLAERNGVWSNKTASGARRYFAYLQNLVRLEAGDEMSPEIMERYSAIKEAKEMIETMEKEKKRTTIVCMECGAKTSVDIFLKQDKNIVFG